LQATLEPFILQQLQVVNHLNNTKKFDPW